MYDPKSGKWSLIDTCFTTHHLYFAHDADNTLWTSAGGPQSGVVGGSTHASMRRPGTKQTAGYKIILDTNGNGKRDGYVGAVKPVRPRQDKRIIAAFMACNRSPSNNSISGRSMAVGFYGIDQPGYIVADPRGRPSSNCTSRNVVPPPDGLRTVGLDVDLDRVVWTVDSSGHLAKLDRSKCKASDPKAVTRAGSIPEGWTLFEPRPRRTA